MKGFKHFRPENGSSQGQNLALTVLCVPNWDLGVDAGAVSRALALPVVRLEDALTGLFVPRSFDSGPGEEVSSKVHRTFSSSLLLYFPQA